MDTEATLCVGCGKNPPRIGVKRCEHCLAYQRRMSRNYHENLKNGIRRKPGRPRKEDAPIESPSPPQPDVLTVAVAEVPVLPLPEEVATEGPLDISGEIDIEM